ncbi:MAG: hypothetical protein AVDCRST_MAG89-4793 [uncultured Gemmatimonadetes bacterium]|uniref:DUF5666 domain-containing protein n=1 Tax=uncultured Gemmatimonadota bacterium TaxID=203437 RepID=A0A6J4MZR8_9BACT|nr:MAG: hypothetical protein AVDCRST_MAG89-4793 [uncultured Gemmatimonadota bacterium]
MPNRKLAAALLLALATTAACERSPTARDESPSPEAPQLAEFGDELFASPDAAGTASFDIRADASTFERTRACPAGGNVTVTGTVERAIDRATQSGTLSVNAKRVENACAFQQRNGVTVTVTGQPSTSMAAKQIFEKGVPGVLTQTQKGAFSWTRSNGKSGTCTVDLTSTFNHATRTATVKGTFCGRAVDETRTR